MNTNIQGQYEQFDVAINNLKNDLDNITNIFQSVKRDYESMPYQSQEASKLQSIFNQDTVSSFNNCCQQISNYINCLENAKQNYIIANQNSLN